MVKREAAVAVARTWLDTRYVLHGRVKGVGCDCGTLIAEYLIEIGAATCADLEDLGFYSHDWFCHEPSERYLLRLASHARRVAEAVARPGVAAAKPGCLALFRVARSKRFNHGAIVTEWPMGIHAYGDKVYESDLSRHRLTAYSAMELFDPFPAS
jgi:cell wall-associated NlpC family hydrolase